MVEAVVVEGGLVGWSHPLLSTCVSNGCRCFCLLQKYRRVSPVAGDRGQTVASPTARLGAKASFIKANHLPFIVDPVSR